MALKIWGKVKRNPGKTAAVLAAAALIAAMTANARMNMGTYDSDLGYFGKFTRSTAGRLPFLRPSRKLGYWEARDLSNLKERQGTKRGAFNAYGSRDYDQEILEQLPEELVS